jgi:hypothetical protein
MTHILELKSTILALYYYRLELFLSNDRWKNMFSEIGFMSKYTFCLV